MAELVGVYAASHGPLIIRNWQDLKPADRESVSNAFAELGVKEGADLPVAFRPESLRVFPKDG